MKTDTIMITELFAFIIKTTSTHETSNEHRCKHILIPKPVEQIWV